MDSILRRIDEGLWTVDLPFSLMGLSLGARSTLARLRSGGLFLCSPGPFEVAHVEAIRSLGEVEAIVAPNSFHHLYLRRAAEHFPRARVFLAPGLREKVQNLPAGEELRDEAPEPWTGAIEQLVVAGSKANEVVFFHAATRTLVLTDLAFNVRRGGAWTRLGMKLNGGFGRFGPTRVLRSTIHDRAAFAASMERIASWDFDRVIVTHGDVVETGGRELFRQAFEL
ncbi:DUF4336 domain-containing protein [Vulgatibacter incomptus]|uniref:Methanol oxidation protein n=1 Tax=Vulgatibacter incomptus TaxID=1391653 RepID=A0A0K1PG50_9BACT|nr:DUF4336 domain-containing protein [Vulgatibacter incomptus]AKU92089.1 Methanol oxidation protein [Vulgatibacter incomptus]